MNPLEFLAAVQPSAGVLCIAELSTPAKEHVFKNNASEFAEHIERFNRLKYNAYFALASFAVPNSRKAANALFLRSMFMDLDCGAGHTYATQKDALKALDAFLKDSGLESFGMPWLVSSGHGVHVYWPLQKDVPVSQWKPVAENLKRLASHYSLALDFSVTADAARVLRIPGTVNYPTKKKSGPPKPVKLVHHAGTFDFEALAAAIKERTPAQGGALRQTKAPKEYVDEIPGVKPVYKNGHDPLHVRLFERKSETPGNFKTLLQLTMDGEGCEQLKYYIENAQEQNSEPVWRGLLSVAKQCTNSLKAARWLSSLHPYDEARMQGKLKEIEGWYLCDKFDSERAGICATCKNHGKIKSPLDLCRELQQDTSPKEVAVSDIRIPRPPAPKGFAYSEHGAVYRLKKAVDEETGEKLSKDILLLPYSLFALNILNDSGEHYVHMIAERPEGAASITIPQSCVVSKSETMKLLAMQNIVASTGQGNDTNLFDYVRACTETLSANKHSVNVPPGNGWVQGTHDFAYRETLYSATGETHVPMPRMANITNSTQSAGTLEDWRKIVDMLIQRGDTDILSAMCLGVGAPLMPFTGLNGLTLHLVSTETGTGKTFALDLAASIWGNPQRFRVGSGTSKVTFEHHLGMLGNLPLLIDEVTNKNRKDFSWFGEWVLDAPQGHGKDRLEGAANRERRNDTSWCTLIGMSSNTHAMDYLTSRMQASNGELARLLEMEFTKTAPWVQGEIDLIVSLQHNYGHVAPLYIRWLVRNHETARELVRKTYLHLKKELSIIDDERYWLAGISSMIAGAIIMGRNYANIIDLPVERIIKRLTEVIEHARGHVASSARTAEDLLNAYAGTFYGKLITVRPSNSQLEISLGQGEKVIDDKLSRAEVCGRVEQGVIPGQEVFYIEETMMKQFCASHSFSYSNFKKQLSRQHPLEYVVKNLLAQTRGPAMRVRCLKIMRPLNEPEQIIAKI